MPRCLVFTLPFALIALSPTVSSAADPNCPDGWLCEGNGPPQPGAPSQPPAPGPGPGSSPPQPAAPPGPSAGPGPAPPPSYPPGYYPAPSYPPGYYPAPSYPPPSYPPPSYPAPSSGSLQQNPSETGPSIEVSPDNPPPKRRRRRGFREWGFNLHLAGALLDNHREHVKNTGLGGLGFAFRYRPLPALALEAGVDVLKGSDHQGYVRTEAALLLNTLVFFNPRDVVQVYALGGLGFSGANVSIEPPRGEANLERYEEHYSYFGGQLGLGLEVRVSQRVALGGDVLAFVRGRSDEQWRDIPEYIDRDSPRTMNPAGGGALRAGITFYW